MSIGERIKGARAMAGLSQRALADAAGVSAMAISKYENDQNIPSSSVLLRLAEALAVKIDYFFRPSSVRLTEPAYRCSKDLTDQQKCSIVEHVREWLERYLDVERLFNEPQTYPLPEKRCVASLDEVEDVALQLRQKWNLGLDPIERLLELLEDRGIKVHQIDGHEKFDALTLYANETMPVIVVKHNVPGDRQRFNLAHELGHLLIAPSESLKCEKVAHRFAAAFLVPKATAELELGVKRHTLSLLELHMLKHKYGLSMNAWLYRAKELHILSEEAANRLATRFKREGWDKKEPGDALQPEEPQRLQRLVIRALAEGMISKSRAAELLGMSLSQFYEQEAERYGDLPVEVCA